MKSPIRSATPVLFHSMPGSYRRMTWTSLALILLLSIFLVLPLRAQAGLPRVAISIATDQSVGTVLTAAQQCDVPGKLIVLPPLSFDFGRGEIPAGLSEKQAVESAPEAAEIWLHVVVEADAIGSKESEQGITDRVNAFVNSLPLSAKAVHGLVVEIKEPLTSSRSVLVRTGASGISYQGLKCRLAAGICFSAGVRREPRRSCEKVSYLLGSAGNHLCRGLAP